MGVLYRVNEGMTYGESNPYAEENVFIHRERENRPLPTYEESKDMLPKPVWDGHADALACYDKAWQIAFSNLRQPTEASGFCSNFIDTAFNGFLFMWDSSFIVMFGKYGARIFDFQATLNNLYSRQHRDGFICREICETQNGEQFFRHDPASTGPNVMAWAEWVYYENFGDKKRVAEVFPPLLGYYQWLRANRTWPDGSYWSSGWGCGMDNTPRLQEGYHCMFSHGHQVWVDACMQQILSGKILCKMAKILGRESETRDVEKEVAWLTEYVNAKLWDEETGFYYDLWRNGELNHVKSLASYWALLADVVPPERLPRFVAHLNNEKEFKRPHRPVTLSADHPQYVPTGDYWRGSVWAPTTYMVLKGLDEVGNFELAHEIAKNHHGNVIKVFNETGTVWENYAPEKAAPGQPAKPDFVGWTGLSPISIFFEYVMGILPDGQNRKITWHVNLTERHGVEKYPLGTDGELDLICEARKDTSEKPVVTVKSNIPVTVEVIWQGGSYTITC